MKKYILNIERLYSGETANALVLNQVEDELPVLLPSMPESEDDIGGWISRCKDIHPEFDLCEVTSRDELNEAIMDFNLELQKRFKGKGHSELYLMDDTQWMKPNDKSFSTDKLNLHLLNGQVVEDVEDEDGNKEQMVANSSQMNVLFPFKKVSSKSLYSEQLGVESVYEIDGKMESSRQMTLQGKVTSEKCLSGIACVGGNLYVMSPLVEGKTPQGNLLSNGMPVVNSFLDRPYSFPHTLTLFQPSRKRYEDPNLEMDKYEDGKTPFINWYNTYNRKTVVSLDSRYGGNISKMTCNGAGSYEIELATYSPTDLVLDGKPPEKIPLNSDTFRVIRADKDPHHKYLDFHDEDGNVSKKYVFDNTLADESGFAKVGFKFNLYDNFISGEERTVRLSIPRDRDFNKLFLRFECKVEHGELLLNDCEYIVFVGDEEKFRWRKDDGEVETFKDGKKLLDEDGKPLDVRDMPIDIPILDTVLEPHECDIKVIIHYAIDFTRRNNEKDYQDSLKESGLTLMDIHIDNDVIDTKRQLTFADYVNEVGITDEERESRLFQFWQVSQYKKDIPYQLVLETSLKNTTSSGIAYPNNYSTGDIYGDVFATKSALDPRYDMNVTPDDLNELLHVRGREYVGLGQCSNQMFLLFKNTNVTVGQRTSNGKVVTKRIDKSDLEIENVKSEENCQ